MHESAPFSIQSTLLALERCFYKDSSLLSRDVLDQETLDKEKEWDKLSLRWLEYFFACDGESVLMHLKDRFSQNEQLDRVLKCIENKYLPLDLQQVTEYQQRRQNSYEHQQPQQQQQQVFII